MTERGSVADKLGAVILKQRPRRLRANPSMRKLLEETQVSASKLCMPLFITEGKDVYVEHKSVPGIITLSVDRLKKYLKVIILILLFTLILCWQTFPEHSIFILVFFMLNILYLFLKVNQKYSIIQFVIIFINFVLQLTLFYNYLQGAWVA